MSNVAALNFKQQLAEAEVIAAKKKADMADASATSILSLTRELKSAIAEGIGVVYFYDPPSVLEREASQKHMRFDQKGMSISMLGVVDGVLARVRTKDGRLMFKEEDRKRLLDLPATSILEIWHAIGGEQGKLAELVSDAEKK
jgi:hypothetical protein